MNELKRFHEAQQNKYSGYNQAYKEISAGQKTSHWIWYILPQLKLKTLGQSGNSQFYGIVNFEEACSYLKDPLLFMRYNEIIRLIEQNLKKGIPLKVIMGSSIDVKKLISSITLFREVASYLEIYEKKPNSDFKTLKDRCDTIFTLIPKNYAPCTHTLTYLKSELTHQDPIQTNTDKPDSQPKKSSPSSLFHKKTSPVENPGIKTPSTLIPNLEQYIQKRRNEWSFHFNFLGIMSVVYFIQDVISGTDHFNNKSREIKISAATKLKHLIDPTVMEQMKPLTNSEITALKDGRLGKLVLEYGGLEQLIQKAQEKGQQNYTYKI